MALIFGEFGSWLRQKATGGAMHFGFGMKCPKIQKRAPINTFCPTHPNDQESTDGIIHFRAERFSLRVFRSQWLDNPPRVYRTSWALTSTGFRFSNQGGAMSVATCRENSLTGLSQWLDMITPPPPSKKDPPGTAGL